MAILTVQRPVLSTSGTTVGFTSATSIGDSFPNTGIEFVHVVNTASSPRTITFDSPGACTFGVSANAAHDIAMVVPGTTGAPNNRVMAGPFPRGRFNDTNGRVQITYDDPSGVTLAVQAVIATQ